MTWKAVFENPRVTTLTSAQRTPYTERVKPPKYNWVVAIVSLDASNMRRYAPMFFPGWSIEQHRRQALFFYDETKEYEKRWQRAIAAAEKKYGAQGPWVSCGLQDHWPTRTKDRVRSLCRAYQATKDAGHFHEIVGSRKTKATR